VAQQQKEVHEEEWEYMGRWRIRRGKRNTSRRKGSWRRRIRRRCRSSGRTGEETEGIGRGEE
jgi:hypothetical protein